MAWASQGHLGTLRDLDSRFHGNVLAAIICDPQVYEQVECKHKDLIFKLYKGSKLFRVMAKSRGFGDRSPTSESLCLCAPICRSPRQHLCGLLGKLNEPVDME